MNITSPAGAKVWFTNIYTKYKSW